LLALFLWVVYDIRMWLEINNYYKDDYKTYISKPQFEKIYRDRGYFYSFIDFVKEKLPKNYNQEISFYTDNKWPFPWSAKYFLYPYKVIINKPSQKIFIVFWYKNAILKNNTLYIDNQKIGKWTVYNFLTWAFIFIKN